MKLTSRERGTRRGAPSQERTKLVLTFVLGVAITVVMQRFHRLLATTPRASNCTISLGKYKGREYEPPSHQRECLVESRYLKVQQHTVQINRDVTVSDWLWIDYHDRINVLVQLANDRGFLVFHQTKYALEEKYSLAIVGGIVEPGEDPANAAPREVAEETSMECPSFVNLGRYRTDVNRGMGWTHMYLAQDCHKQEEKRRVNTIQDEVGVHDTERQDLKFMSFAEIRSAVKNGEFMEVQWTATVSLALMYIDEQQKP